MESQKKLNNVLVIILAVASVATVLCGQFNWLANLSMVLGLIITFSTAGIAMLEVYKYQEFYDYKPFKFWFRAAYIAGILFAVTCMLGCTEVLSERLTDLLLLGCAYFVIPFFGSCLGYVARYIVDLISEWRWHWIWSRKHI